MHFICRCACTLHKAFNVMPRLGFFPHKHTHTRAWASLWWAYILCYREPVSQTCIKHQSLSQGRGHTDWPDRRPESAAALKPSLLPPRYRAWAALPPFLPPARLASGCGSVRLTGQMLLLEAGHSWLDPSCYASIFLLQAAVTAPTFPTLRRDKQTVISPVHVHTQLVQSVYFPLFSSTVGSQCTHLLLASARRPATITDQRRDVTMRLWIIFRYRNRSADDTRVVAAAAGAEEQRGGSPHTRRFWGKMHPAAGAVRVRASSCRLHTLMQAKLVLVGLLEENVTVKVKVHYMEAHFRQDCC